MFASDRPRNGAAHLYPQHDEYESTATVTGLWRLDPATGALWVFLFFYVSCAAVTGRHYLRPASPVAPPAPRSPQR